MFTDTACRPITLKKNNEYDPVDPRKILSKNSVSTIS